MLLFCLIDQYVLPVWDEIQLMFFFFFFGALRTDLGKCFPGNMFSHMQADISDTLVGTRMGGGGTEY